LDFRSDRNTVLLNHREEIGVEIEVQLLAQEAKMASKIAVVFFCLFILIVAVFKIASQKSHFVGSRESGQAPESEIVFQANQSEKDDLSIAKTNRQSFKVVRVIDGDTVKLETGESLRYIGIDTPETKHPQKPVQYLGKEASAFNTKLVFGQDILVEFDVQQRDKYGRLLGYVFLRDGTFVNAELVKKGYAKVATFPPNVLYSELFLKLQAEAVIPTPTPPRRGRTRAVESLEHWYLSGLGKSLHQILFNFLHHQLASQPWGIRRDEVAVFYVQWWLHNIVAPGGVIDNEF
jgi:endonuclease YncB( thermonuclease family)